MVQVINTIQSLEKDDHMRIVVYDMGMEKNQRELVESHINRIQNKSADGTTLAAIRDFRYSDYPDHFRLGSFQTFAWKGVLLESVMDECGGSVLWLNSGQLSTGKFILYLKSINICNCRKILFVRCEYKNTASSLLNEVRKILALDGIVVTSTRGAIKYSTHVGMRTYLKIDENTLTGKSTTPILDAPLLSGAIIGFNSGNKVCLVGLFP